jgi:hypothetical protein
MATRDFVEGVLTGRNFTAFIGRAEDLWFEAKERHELSLQQGAQRIELSKDVSALANSDGGFLIFGLKTAPVADERTDRVTALDLLAPGDFNAPQIAGVIREHIHPQMTGLEVKFVESAETPGSGLGCIIVPPQDPDRQPFLMKRVWDDGGELKQIVFGIARRAGSSNEPRTVEELYRAVQQGKASTPERLTRVESKLNEIWDRLQQPAIPAPPQPAPADSLAERTKRLLGNGE